jgi:hypothetical protein
VAKRLPPIYVDEHLAPEVARAFRDEGFRVIEARRSRGFAGRDEMEPGGTSTRSRNIRNFRPASS